VRHMAGINSTSGLRLGMIACVASDRPSVSVTTPGVSAMRHRDTVGVGRSRLACAAARKISRGKVMEVASMREWAKAATVKVFCDAVFETSILFGYICIKNGYSCIVARGPRLTMRRRLYTCNGSF